MTPSLYPPDLVAETRRGNLVAFVGAGMSIPAGGPSWSALLDEMLKQLGVDFGFDSDKADILAAIGSLTAQKKATNLLNRLYDPLVVAEVFDKRFSRHALVSLLRTSLGGIGAPTPSHMTLAELPLWAIVTTNYDALLSKACSATGRKTSIVVKEEDVAYLERDALAIVKMHGSLDDPFDADSVVIARSDYDNYELRHPNVSAYLKFAMSTRTLLLIGYSVSDPNFLLLHNQIWHFLKGHRRKMYWLTFDMPDVLLDYWNRYGVQPIVLDSANKTKAVESWLSGFRAIV